MARHGTLLAEGFRSQLTQFLQPDCIPVGVVAQPFDQTGTDWIHHYVPGYMQDVVFTTQRPVMETTCPDLILAAGGFTMDTTSCVCLEPAD
jgi:hypothetical protein